MRYVVLGSAGQLGRDICPRLDGQVLPWTRAEVDLTDAAGLKHALNQARPDIVINCAAYNLVDRAETEPDAAFAVNAWAIRNLAQACNDMDSTLVHYSTDYVFGLDAQRNRPYEEQEAPGPVSVYGLSKLTGEYLVRSLCSRHLVIRTCGLYGVWGSGGKGGNFVETMLRLAGQGKPLRVVADQICTPSYTVDVAEASIKLIRTGRFGIYHLTNQGSCSWHELAATIFEKTGTQADLTPITSREFGAAARRPPYSVLASTAYRSLELPELRSWRDALAAYLEERRRRQTARGS